MCIRDRHNISGGWKDRWSSDTLYVASQRWSRKFPSFRLVIRSVPENNVSLQSTFIEQFTLPLNPRASDNNHHLFTTKKGLWTLLGEKGKIMDDGGDTIARLNLNAPRLAVGKLFTPVYFNVVVRRNLHWPLVALRSHLPRARLGRGVLFLCIQGHHRYLWWQL